MLVFDVTKYVNLLENSAMIRLIISSKQVKLTLSYSVASSDRKVNGQMCIFNILFLRNRGHAGKLSHVWSHHIGALTNHEMTINAIHVTIVEKCASLQMGWKKNIHKNKLNDKNCICLICANFMPEVLKVWFKRPYLFKAQLCLTILMS